MESKKNLLENFINIIYKNCDSSEHLASRDDIDKVKNSKEFLEEIELHDLIVKDISLEFWEMRNYCRSILLNFFPEKVLEIMCLKQTYRLRYYCFVCYYDELKKDSDLDYDKMDIFISEALCQMFRKAIYEKSSTNSCNFDYLTEDFSDPNMINEGFDLFGLVTCIGCSDCETHNVKNEICFIYEEIFDNIRIKIENVLSKDINKDYKIDIDKLIIELVRYID